MDSDKLYFIVVSLLESAIRSCDFLNLKIDLFDQIYMEFCKEVQQQKVVMNISNL